MKNNKLLIALLILASPLSLTGCDQTKIPEGTYKPDSSINLWFKVNGRKVKIEEIKARNSELNFLLSVENNETFKPHETSLPYSLNKESKINRFGPSITKINLFGSSNSALYLTLQLDYTWQLKGNQIIQTNKKGTNVETYSLTNP
jgi:hypothetical protein